MERSFQRRIESLDPIFLFLDEVAAHHGFDASVSYLINLVVEELFTNIVKYGRQQEQEVPISVEKEDGRVVIRIVDNDAPDFDPTHAPRADTEASLSQRKVGGLGIHLIREMVDGFEYNYDGRRSEIVVVKNLEN